MWNHVPFANSCHSSNWWDLFTRQTILSRYKAQSRQRKLVLFCWLDYLSLEDSCTEGILPERTRNHLFLGIYADSGWHLAAGQSVSVPLVTASVPPCSLQAPGTDPAGLPTPSPASRGLFISWQPQGPSYKHLSTRHATQLLFSITSAMVLFLWQNEALPPLICLQLSNNLSAAHIPSQNMAV